MWRQVVSRSPKSISTAASLDEYRTAWQATMQLLRQGHSFSGHERNCAYLNCGNMVSFANTSSVTGLDFDDDGRAIGATDWDHDGDLDLWIVNRTGPRLRFMRNQLQESQDDHPANWVAFQLEGTQSNRDAIGARVAIQLDGAASRPLVQTLVAGDAFLSQSSKSLHFGLGPRSIQQVTVRWPSGRTQTFHDIKPNDRYHLVEGQKSAVLHTGRRTGQLAPLMAQPQQRKPIDGARRTMLSNRLPLPPLEYDSLDTDRPGTSHRFPPQANQPNGRPSLLVVWASWCTPCLTEMADLVVHRQSIQAADLDIVALSIDGMQNIEGPAANAGDAVERLEQLNWPFAHGQASRTLLDKLELAKSVVFNQQQPFEIPLSFLCDKRGHLAAIYHGPISLEQLLSDVAKLETPPTERRDLAVPLAGRWVTPPRTLLLLAVARMYRDRGYENDYAYLLEQEAKQVAARRAAAENDTQRQQWNHQYANAHFNLGITLLQSGREQEAAEHFQSAIAADPNHAESLTNLGTMMAQRNQLKPAIILLRRALAANAEQLQARRNLANALSQAEEFSPAIPHYRWLLARMPDDAELHARLGRALLRTDEPGQAAQHFELALQRQPNDVRSTLCLTWIRATSPSAALRDGNQAIRLAQRLLQHGGNRNPMFLDAAAAAYAEAGQFDTAIKLLEALLKSGGLPEPLRPFLEKRLDRYANQQPYRDADSRYP